MPVFIPVIAAGAAFFGSATLYDRRNRQQSKTLVKVLQKQPNGNDSSQQSWVNDSQSALQGFIADEVSPRLDDLKARIAAYTAGQPTNGGWTPPNPDAPALSEIRQEETGFQKSLTVALGELEEKYQWFIKTRIDPLFQGRRHAVMEELGIDDDGDLQISPYERQVNRQLALSGVITVAAVATASAGGVVAFVACVPLALYLIRDIYKRAYRSIKDEHQLTMPVLVAVNQTLLWFGGFYTIGGIIFILTNAGQKLSIITEVRSQRQLSNIFGKLPRHVWVLRESVEIEIPFDQLHEGDVLVVRAGQMIPIDGSIVNGYASIDQHRLTGEAQPAEKGVGDGVLAATVVLAGQIYVRVEKTGQATVAAQIGEMLNKTASYQMALTTRAFQMANASVAPTLAAALLAGLIVGPVGVIAITSTMFGLNFLISGPLALRNYLLVATRRNILIKDGRSLDLLTEIDTVVFDKTGTLTLEQPHVAQVYTFTEMEASAVLRYAAAVEQRQSHPIARAILACAQERHLALPSIDDTRYEMGYGLLAGIEGKVIRVGSDRFMALEEISLPPEAQALQESCHAKGHSLVMVAVDDQLTGAIELQPTIRPEAAAVIEELRGRNLDFYIISGDQEGPTRTLAQTLGIANYFANTLPENKAQLVEQLQAEGRAVCFVGDGINDSIALKKANVSVSLRGSTTVAMDTAQIVLLDTTLQQLPLLFKLAEEMDENLKTTQTLAVVPSLGIWAGVFFFHLGILGAVFIFEASLWVGIANALRPLLRYKESEDEKEASEADEQPVVEIKNVSNQ